ncbi:PREDICTED: CD63 antigen [Rhagoletis zephyria]|uniref:CD63 antigen n=1 Tax=Rhagoletis zephyria TaxID=28612 RepID=UPI000811714E|nr:PREDICTED: CD63 antigen [Rhagoletis zephyria]XP_017479002.1 PREDICTED: CD63 antigen [Rhagoletis zephyria]XP_017479010.1 PREDICTED: CD63 antigen [Rhagoletis zephyria]XP_017479018.1 PREDICTED: CD63 antigen [Rhagoletis zephyria]XP_036321543.1 CD63 antigen [Rhagoletis pomonella]XP_036321544.1 CD63 antigen [Rhagoletis pomonella]XP_036321545.1 CD63 antigen [Rhagoletis pomonella]XP_036321546.1 CD63 antigen [Rhagoletis pomonella]
MSLLTGSANTIKYVLFAFNLVFMITGIILIAVGVGVAAVFTGYDIWLVSKFFSIPTFLIVIGVFVIFISFFGCWGALKENYILILIFSILLGLIFILELAAGISGYVLRSDASNLIETSLNDSLKSYNRKDPTNSYTITWDYAQRAFGCCGVKNYTDWTDIYDGEMPLSCCDIPDGIVGAFNCSSATENKYRHSTGCLSGFSTFIEAHAVSLGACGIVLAIIQFFGVIFACYIAREIRIRNGITSIFG